jgi:hypothetical protein
MEKNRPCFEKRVGNIRLAIWEITSDNNGTPRRWHNVSVLRRYKDGQEWKEAPTYNGLGDLAQAALAIQLAVDWISQRQYETQAAPDEATE